MSSANDEAHIVALAYVSIIVVLVACLVGIYLDMQNSPSGSRR
jgi:hypothetical protein